MLIIFQIDWRKVGVALSCNAFAIARFLVLYFTLGINNPEGFKKSSYAKKSWNGR